MMIYLNSYGSFIRKPIYFSNNSDQEQIIAYLPSPFKIAVAKPAKHIVFTWQTAAVLEFTFLSISGSYKPYKDVLRGNFYRTLSLCGVAEPRKIATDEQREQCIKGYSTLELRPGCEEAFGFLRENGFIVWCFTTDDIERVKGYFERAGVEMPLENVVTCDEAGVAKSALVVYESVYKRFAAEEIKWFAAAHLWDVAAATEVGFRGAWSAVYEKEACLDKLEVLADSLMDMSRAIVDKSQ